MEKNTTPCALFMRSGNTIRSLNLETRPEKLRKCMADGAVKIITNDGGPEFIVNYAHVEAIAIGSSRPSLEDELRAILYPDNDPERQWGSDELAALAQLMQRHGLAPKEE